VIKKKEADDSSPASFFVWERPQLVRSAFVFTATSPSQTCTTYSDKRRFYVCISLLTVYRHKPRLSSDQWSRFQYTVTDPHFTITRGSAAEFERRKSAAA
jgi:hypothetical protein